MIANQADHTTTTSLVAQIARVDGCTAYERISSISRLRNIAAAAAWTANDKVLVFECLVAHSIRLVYLFVGAASRASEGVGCTVEWAAEIAIDTAIISSSPMKCISGRSLSVIGIRTIVSFRNSTLLACHSL